LFLTKYHAMKTYRYNEDIWGNGGIAPRIINIATRWRWMVRFMSRALYPRGNSPGCPLDRRLSGPQELVWMR